MIKRERCRVHDQAKINHDIGFKILKIELFVSQNQMKLIKK